VGPSLCPGTVRPRDQLNGFDTAPSLQAESLSMPDSRARFVCVWLRKEPLNGSNFQHQAGDSLQPRILRRPTLCWPASRPCGVRRWRHTPQA
jgi:hypothetical protein